MTTDEIRNFSDAVSELLIQYEEALNNRMVKKPLAFALYQTWQHFDRVEKERK